MKKLFLLIAGVVVLSLSGLAQVTDTTQVAIANLQVLPTFPGGFPEMYKFIRTNMQYPVVASDAKVDGKVMVGFAVAATGELSNFKVDKSSYLAVKNEAPSRKLAFDALDNEALRIMKLMPKWIPGKADGKAVNVRKLVIPVSFRLK